MPVRRPESPGVPDPFISSQEEEVLSILEMAHVDSEISDRIVKIVHTLAIRQFQLETQLIDMHDTDPQRFDELRHAALVRAGGA